MPGLVPGIHVFMPREVKGVDGRDKPGHDKFPILWDVIEPNCVLCVSLLWISGRSRRVFPNVFEPEVGPMVVTATELSPLVAIIAGILILVMPRLLNYIVAIYLIFVGLVELNAVHHFVHLG